jgi:hypothetical protein
LNAVIRFLIVSFAVFWRIKVLTRLHVREDAKPRRRRPRYCSKRSAISWRPGAASLSWPIGGGFLELWPSK